MRKLRLLGTVALGGLFAISFTASAASFDTNQVEQIQKITHDYLLANPRILVDMSRKLQQQEQVKSQAVAQKLIRNNAKAIFGAAGDPTAGNPNGDVSIVEFFDYQCPHCKVMSPIVDKMAQDDPQLRIVYKELPIFGKNSQYAARAALASNKQKKYQAFHGALMAAELPLTQKKVLAAAKSVGLDVTQLQADMKDASIDKTLKDNFKLAQAVLQPAMGIIATPALIIGNQNGSQFGFVPGETSAAVLQQAVSAVR